MDRHNRYAPLQSGEACKVTIKRDPLTAPFDGKSRKPGVGDTWSARFRLKAEMLENLPMPFTGLDKLTVRLAKQAIAELECLLSGARHSVCTRVGGHANYSAQHKRRYSEAGIARYDASEPPTAERMLGDVLAKRIDEDIYVRQDHLNRFIRSMYSRSSISCNAENEVRSMPGIGPPVALLTGGNVRGALPTFFFSATTILSPSSMSAVSVRPSAFALRLARSSKALGSRTVVRSAICQDI